MPVILACVLVPILAISVVRAVDYYLTPSTDSLTDLTAGAAWIAANAKTDAIVICRNPASRYLYTRRPTTGFPETESETVLLREIDSQSVSYVLVAPEVTIAAARQLDAYQVDHVLPLMQRHPGRFRLVYSSEDEHVSVFQVVRDD